MSTAGAISLRASLSDLVLLLIRFDPFPSFLSTRILILFEEAIEMLALVVVFESGKVLLQRTGESLASGILSSTLVWLFLFKFENPSNCDCGSSTED